MNFLRFSLFTAAGAGLWVILLTAFGYWFGTTTEGMTYGQLVYAAKALLQQNLLWILIGCAVVMAVYVWVHRLASAKKAGLRP